MKVTNTSYGIVYVSSLNINKEQHNYYNNYDEAEDDNDDGKNNYDINY